jgi:hypothetical protein
VGDALKPKTPDDSESRQGALDPHGAEERHAVALEGVARLRSRGIVLTGRETNDELAALLTAVERFEVAVEAHGGDLMVDDLKSSRPDDVHFVLPRRGLQEGMRVYIARINEATTRLLRHPPRPD